jgi:hypothetical protein
MTRFLAALLARLTYRRCPWCATSTLRPLDRSRLVWRCDPCGQEMVRLKLKRRPG